MRGVESPDRDGVRTRPTRSRSHFPSVSWLVDRIQSRSEGDLPRPYLRFRRWPNVRVTVRAPAATGRGLPLGLPLRLVRFVVGLHLHICICNASKKSHRESEDPRRRMLRRVQ